MSPFLAAILRWACHPHQTTFAGGNPPCRLYWAHKITRVSVFLSSSKESAEEDEDEDDEDDEDDESEEEEAMEDSEGEQVWPAIMKTTMLNWQRYRLPVSRNGGIES